MEKNIGLALLLLNYSFLTLSHQNVLTHWKKGFHISAVNHANFTFTLLKKNVFAFFATKLENSDIRRQTSKS